MFNRACHILGQSTEKKTASETPGSAAGVARLSECERLSRWKSLLLKISLVFQTIAQTTKAKFLLGNLVFENMFQSKKLNSALQQPIHYRFVRGQVVGRILPPGSGKKDQNKAHMDPAMCAHQDEDLLARGNKVQQWWTCKKCLSRWERLESSEVTSKTAEPQDQDLVTFGKHSGSTYLEVYQKDQPYCTWISEALSHGELQNGPILRLARYVELQQIAETFEADEEFDMEL
jgi:hypothetical protein